ncbi:uncharacterized protein GGS22DRAFT_160907 [Annulohypoxylon maeteangense]|uniref:uncharacterized protein n=1 Tax=Annulohypoxylon maeteangense TaxID=1927788 RepID=UPI002007B9B7|nr:uncharacterized protein GGS22DRAFT_160907 [Annulohypoxylon maeteangense]KAI0885440.1 hypothetical protein GGS22DRAFT_160907 [Annulohypoxylon maeteangense]
MLLSRVRITPTCRALFSYRGISTLSNNPYIKVFPNATVDNGHLLTFLDTNPPSHRLAIGSTAALPPTPQSFSENYEFMSILTEVLRNYAAHDPDLLAQAHAFAGPGGATLGSGGAFFPQQRKQRGTKGSAAGLGGGGGAGGGGGGGASAQGGAGGAGIGGHIHLSDLRNPPDYGRIAWPEDILGSIEVDGSGNIVGEFQPSGTYRIVTNEGILGLSDFLRTKLVERLKEEENKG